MGNTSSPALFENSVPLLDHEQLLRERADRDGFLFFRGILPPQPLLELRREITGVLAKHGWLAAGTDAMDGILDPDAVAAVPPAAMRSDVGVSSAIYDDVQRLEAFHALPHHPLLIELFTKFLGGEVLVHPRHIARLITSHPSVAPTPEHQDYIHIQGTARTWTCWLPLGDCPRSMGGLTMLRGSHRQGVIKIRPEIGAGGKAVQLCPTENDWVEGDYLLGDVILFNSLTVHRALRSTQRDRARLSLDVRYQRFDEAIEPASLFPHCQLTWPEIYKNWMDDTYQYYWSKRQLRLSRWQDQLRWQKERICS